MTEIPRDDLKTIASWCMFDWANSAFTTLVVTFIYSYYFTQAIAPDELTGTALWSRAVGLSAVVIAGRAQHAAAAEEAEARKV